MWFKVKVGANVVVKVGPYVVVFGTYLIVFGT